jgi:2-phosphosulfolactate phosphatase
MKIETILSPAELPALARQDLRDTACIVFDILRATSTFVTALQNGAKAVIPVSDIPEALALRKKHPDILLAGERDGVKIRAKQSGGVDFDFGNSPREFIPSAVAGKTIVSTTTNGTLALRDCASGKVVLAAAFLNLAATAAYLKSKKFTNVLLVCAGTGEGVAMEDVLAAGAMAELLAGDESDATKTARQTWLQLNAGLEHAIAGSKNGQRLIAIPALREDVAFCAQRNVVELVAVMGADGKLERAKL